MPEDVYKRFDDLKAGERARGPETYCIRVRATVSPVVIIAPHGGWIEAGTSELAAAVAGSIYNFYTLEGLPPVRGHNELHLASHRFDEPLCRELVSKCDFVIALHGRRDNGDTETIFLGGLDNALRGMIAAELKNAGFSSKIDTEHFPATDPKNICNMGQRRQGVQLELPKSLRGELLGEKRLANDFAMAIRKATDARKDEVGRERA